MIFSDQNLYVVRRCRCHNTKHSGIRRFKIVQVKGTAFLQGEIIKKWWKCIVKLKEIFFSRTTVSISTNFCVKHILVKGIKVCSNEEPVNFQNVDNGVFSSLDQRYDEIIWLSLLIWPVFSGERCGPWASCLTLVPIGLNWIKKKPSNLKQNLVDI